MTGAARTLVALLRGINVGKANRLPMADLRRWLEELGCSRVRTLLASGNAVFSSPETEAAAAGRIREKIRAEAGFEVPVLVRSAAALAGLAEANPLAAVAGDPPRLLVAFLAGDAERDRLQELAARDWGAERLVVEGEAAWVWCPDGVHASRLWDALNRALKGGVTSRNWSTVQKLAALAREAG